MNNHSISFSPIITDNLFSDRFNQIDKIFSTLTGEKPITDLPGYDFIKFSDTRYQLVILVPGYQEKELDISIQNKQLTISGRKSSIQKEEQTKKVYLHKGIKNNHFTVNFNLNNPIKIISAILELGLLKINFEYEIPNEEQVKKINIQKK
ncbi:Hsp20 family protein [Buchnera aphidicola]|uniref:Heat-shock protein n=1 Tax=Buchnera aphidicola (Stegophylla sp.) TaxID=2315800 RepID=A0A4D6Y9U3_9GAMM|nr:Hsp20 family protein [Buchnera aphidicola (Stegophylla sp.)]QCI26517.1 heat-shock protein [Buchnera aphidicola (Stegophylla sp.)]